MTITPKDLMNYGYTYDGMDGLNRQAALEAFDKGKAVYLLYPDNTEGMAITRDEIEKFDGMFGTEKQKYTNGKSPTTYMVMDSKDDYTLLKREINENGSDPTPYVIAYKFKTYNGNKCDWARGIYVSYLDKAEQILREKTFTNNLKHISDSHPSTLVTLMKKESGERLEQLRRHYYELITNCDMYDGIYPYHLKDMQYPSDIVAAVEEIYKSNDCYDERRQIENTTMLCKKVMQGATLEEIMSHKDDVANDIENLFALNSRFYAKPKKSKGIEMSR